jgi:hypothetical protein
MSKFNTFIKLYGNTMPIITLYSTFLGIDTGFTINRRIPYRTPFDTYSNLIGYTSLGIMTGITYPISYPAFGMYVLYKN